MKWWTHDRLSKGGGRREEREREREFTFSSWTWKMEEGRRTWYSKLSKNMMRRRRKRSQVECRYNTKTQMHSSSVFLSISFSNSVSPLVWELTRNELEITIKNLLTPPISEIESFVFAIERVLPEFQSKRNVPWLSADNKNCPCTEEACNVFACRLEIPLREKVSAIKVGSSPPIATTERTSPSVEGRIRKPVRIPNRSDVANPIPFFSPTIEGEET